ncbi:MAG TPA: hypothetical protein ENK18_16870 [Deltaproteobacteria bacterium]|nr:hypothetical protein [Deltaproteobacteria bacterium]
MENAVTDEGRGWGDDPAPLGLGSELGPSTTAEAPCRWPLIAGIVLLVGGGVSAVAVVALLVLGAVGYGWYSSGSGPELPTAIPIEAPASGVGRSDADLVIMPDPAKDGGSKGDKGDKETAR